MVNPIATAPPQPAQISQADQQLRLLAANRRNSQPNTETEDVRSPHLVANHDQPAAAQVQAAKQNQNPATRTQLSKSQPSIDIKA